MYTCLAQHPTLSRPLQCHMENGCLFLIAGKQLQLVLSIAGAASSAKTCRALHTAAAPICSKPNHSDSGTLRTAGDSWFVCILSFVHLAVLPRSGVLKCKGYMTGYVVRCDL